jgi:hypothetical protein
MFDLPQLVWLVLVIWAVWYGLRWLKALPRDPGSTPPPRPGMRPGGRQGPPPRIEVEDLVACRVCSTYVAAGAPACGRRGCPRPR